MKCEGEWFDLWNYHLYLFKVFVELIKAKHSSLIFPKWVLLKIKFLMKSILLWNKSNLWKPSSYVHSHTTTITIIIYRFILHSCVIAGWCWHCKYNDIISSNNHWQNFSQCDFMFYVNKPRIKISRIRHSCFVKLKWIEYKVCWYQD